MWRGAISRHPAPLLDNHSTLDRYTAALSVAVGACAVASAVTLGVFFAVGGPFGTLNDVLNGLLAVLSGYLAWRLSGRTVFVYVALLGEVIAVIGSILVIFNVTGFFLAGLVSSLGFALIGLWLLTYCWSLEASSLRWLGVAAGALMLIGVAVIPGIVLRLDDMSKAPPWIWVGFVSWLGIYVAYPAWAIWSGLANQSAR
jgi:hypothetical protein